MDVYLLYRTLHSSGIHTELVTAADEATARSLANAAATTGSTKVPATWWAMDLSAMGSNDVIWLEGDAVSLLGLTRGGDPI